MTSFITSVTFDCHEPLVVTGSLSVPRTTLLPWTPLSS